jgi:hypothetical protein
MELSAGPRKRCPAWPNRTAPTPNRQPRFPSGAVGPSFTAGIFGPVGHMGRGGEAGAKCEAGERQSWVVRGMAGRCAGVRRCAGGDGRQTYGDREAQRAAARRADRPASPGLGPGERPVLRRGTAAGKWGVQGGQPPGQIQSDPRGRWRWPAPAGVDRQGQAGPKSGPPPR